MLNRRTLPLLLMAALSVVAIEANAAQIVIDSFENPVTAQSYFISNGPLGNINPLVIQQSATGILAGQRDVQTEVLGSPGSLSAAGLIGGAQGLFQLATFGTPGARAILQYDGIDTDPADHLNDALGLGPVDLTGGGTNSAFLLTFLSVDAGDGSLLSLKADVVGDTGTASFVGQVPQGYGSFDYVIPFSSFSMSSPLASAKSITFELNGSGGAIPNVDYQLDRILVVTTPVPEPSVVIMLSGLASLGVAPCLRRWRRPSPQRP